MWFFYPNFVNLIVTDMGPRLIHVNPFKVSCVKILSKHVKFWKSYQRKLILVFFQMFTLVADIYELVQYNTISFPKKTVQKIPKNINKYLTKQ